MQILHRPKFVDDLIEAHAHQAEEAPSAADRLFDDVEAVSALLAAFPGIGAVERSSLLAFDRTACPVSNILMDDMIMFLRLLHGAREIRPDLMLP